jgi:hypothetical protein
MLGILRFARKLFAFRINLAKAFVFKTYFAKPFVFKINIFFKRQPEESTRRNPAILP